MEYNPKRLTIVTGHYGSGKTNLCVNYALWLHRMGHDTTLADIDIVNPYFRSADFASILTDAGIRVVNPQFANTNLDLPTLSANVASVFSPNTYGVIDVGGDDAGAAALGAYSGRIAAEDYDMLYVINRARLLTQTPEDAVAVLRDIERVSRVRATGIINNTNLGKETTEQEVLDSLPYAREVARMTGLPLVATTVREEPRAELQPDHPLWPVRIFVRLPWDQKAEV